MFLLLRKFIKVVVFVVFMKCEVCAMEDGKYRCSKCGKMVGSSCYNSKLNVCVNCGPKAL